MEESKLQKDIRVSGLKKTYLAEKLGISPAHFSMMLSDNANMPEATRNKLNEILKQALQIA